MIPVTRPRRDWVAMLATLRPCRAEVQSVGDAYRNHGEWAAASVLERGIATIEAALARRGDPVTITGPRWRWDQLLIALDLGCEELGKSFDLKLEKPAADREHVAIRDLLRKPA